MNDDWKQQLDRLHAEMVERNDPAEWVAEADAVDASHRYPYVAVRGPVFGIAVQDPRRDRHWRLLTEMADGLPQQARDGLNSHLWFQAKDETDDPAVRRELLAAVAVLEREPVNELEALGLRYRVVRADEFVRSGDDGLEPARPTDREPDDRSWDGRYDMRLPDPGYVLEPGRSDTSPATAALRLGLRDFVYTDTRIPKALREDSHRAVTTHPDMILLPTGFSIAERNEKGWRPQGSLLPSPHDARRMLYDAMTETWPLIHQFDEAQKAVYAKAAERFKNAGRANEVHVGDSLFRICRIERLARSGPDGPEPPRPSDRDQYEPMKMHPTMDEDGTLHHDD
ncbi:DUF5954 family protein [Streptomyces sp. NPDC091292]|uniref:DUF5954 family protein n=1 Tax=Streptomyces sp. NPDC091292 TaxID=3365991 RepID=UPI003806171B